MILLSLLLLLLHHLSPSTAADSADLTHFCSGQNYTTNSTYNSNLNALFTSLSLSSSNSTFANTTSGSSPDRAYGLFLCRGDISPSDCEICVQNATKSILSLCHQRKQAIIWYDYCELGYADARFFSVVNETVFTILINTDSATSVGSFVNMKTTFVNMETRLLDAVTHGAAYNSSMKFATGVVVDSSLAGVTVYALAQCTRDLLVEGCDRCLQQITGFYGTYERTVGGRVVGKSCNFRYEPEVFFGGKPMFSLDLSAKQAAVPAAAPPTEQLTSARGRGRGGRGGARVLHFLKIQISSALNHNPLLFSKISIKFLLE